LLTEDSTERHLLLGFFDYDVCGAMLDRALRANISGPVVIEAVVDLFETPTPAKATLTRQLNSLWTG
jgi:hypothetical protein